MIISISIYNIIQTTLPNSVRIPLICPRPRRIYAEFSFYTHHSHNIIMYSAHVVSLAVNVYVPTRKILLYYCNIRFFFFISRRARNGRIIGAHGIIRYYCGNQTAIFAFCSHQKLRAR